jgi:hypothetical protein
MPHDKNLLAGCIRGCQLGLEERDLTSRIRDVRHQVPILAVASIGVK